MASERIDRLRAGLDKFNETGEIGTDFIAPDFEMQQASSIVDTAGVFRGRRGLRDSIRELEGAFDDISLEGEQFVDAPGDVVVVVVRVRARGRGSGGGSGSGSGMSIDNRVGWV